MIFKDNRKKYLYNRVWKEGVKEHLPYGYHVFKYDQLGTYKDLLSFDKSTDKSRAYVVFMENEEKI